LGITGLDDRMLDLLHLKQARRALSAASEQARAFGRDRNLGKIKDNSLSARRYRN
jgi:hypothetical protein